MNNAVASCCGSARRETRTTRPSMPPYGLAQAFQSEIDSLFIEDGQLFDLADLPFTREISLSGRPRSFSMDGLARDMQTHASALQRRVLARAHAADVVAHARVVRADPVGALARACTENGPWNVVTVGAPVQRRRRGRWRAGLC